MTLPGEKTSANQESVYAKWKDAQGKTYTGWMATAAKLGFYAYLIADPEITMKVFGLSSPAKWKILLWLVAFHLGASLSMSVSGGLVSKYTGIVYAHDRAGFAKAGGYDVGYWSPLAAQLGLFGVYWWTALGWDTDPIAVARSPWIYLLVTTVLGMLLTWIVGAVVFRAYARRNPEVVFHNLMQRSRR